VRSSHGCTVVHREKALLATEAAEERAKKLKAANSDDQYAQAMRTVRGLTAELSTSVADKKSLVDELEAVRTELRASERRAEAAEHERLRTAIEKGDLLGEIDEMKEESSASVLLPHGDASLHASRQLTSAFNTRRTAISRRHLERPACGRGGKDSETAGKARG
jgi:DNA repair exonuclease SbcCD ATPase subunit